MKKYLPLLLALSLVANAALVITHFRGAPAKTPAIRISADKKAGRDAANAAAAAVMSAAPDETELVALHEKLVASGIPPEVARDVTRALLWKPLQDRQRAMIEAKNAGKPYWQQTRAGKQQLTAAERAELRAISEQIEARAASLFPGEYNSRATTRYGFLPADKAAAIYQLQRDYANMTEGVAEETSLFRVPSDNASRKLLREEQRRDLEAILSPAELAEYDLRHSPAAAELRKRFAALPDSTEAEYKTAYAIAQSLNESKNDPAAQKLAAQQLRDLFGPERYTEFLRANDSDYAALQGAAARFDLPAATVEKVYGLRDQAVSLSQQIAADKSLSQREKQQALRTLASQMRADVRNNLGDEIGNAYLNKNMTWLESLSKGNVLNSSATGKISSKPVPAAKKTGSGNKQQKGANKSAKGKTGKTRK
ncbi:hypothetical protein M2103_000428 [Ereboglobus sp. PH5-5]|uniref:hypothetical protein n=1 Tax=Ereboglobus sp. PH5-5 TaxID=2940529 RepID=UPI002404EAD0|nr:hypothetical protein [Ereboglobus sp. PH5-5]MDF9832220.1 hypothetical protein [Ereboglobus sp. PH5-5]